MNGATLISATVVVNSSPKKINLNDSVSYGTITTNNSELQQQLNDSSSNEQNNNHPTANSNVNNNNNNDDNDDTETDSDEEEFVDFDDQSAVLVANDSRFSISSSAQPSENNNIIDCHSPERTSSIAARLRTNRKSRCSDSNRDNNKLDSVRFSMYAIQNSQLNEIDALLSELNQLQNTLDYSAINKNFAEIEPPNEQIMNTTAITTAGSLSIKPLSSSSASYLQSSGPATCYTSHNNHADEIEAIDQQFDEVLKFLAQSINEQTALSVSSSATSSPSAVSLIQNNSNHLKKDRSSGSSSSSNSSGIGDDFESSSTIKSKTQTDESKILAQFNQQDQQQQQLQQVKKRNSTDSAFLETISMPSSHSLTAIETNNKHINKSNSHQVSFSVGNPAGSGEPSPVSHSSKETNGIVLMEKSLSPTQMAEAQKAEMIRIALEKLKEANIRKLIVKAYTDDGCTKSVIIDETMKCYDVMLLLFSKNHTKPSIKYSVVEYLPKFHMERIFEDHENIVDAMSNWSRDSENQIIFTEKDAKYDLFTRPELYLLSEPNSKIDETHRNKLLNEFFQNIGSPVPELEGPLYIKVESKKSWKKYYCVLRQSGLYFIPKGKNKKDLQCLFNFDKLDLYFGIDWRKKFKAPTNSCFALKLPQVQKKSSKYIKYVCCENDQDMKRWFNGIRIAKFGKQLYDNYKKILDLIEMNKVSGRLPMASSRRLSASINNKAQRPRSSYSLISGTNSEETTNNASFNSTTTTNNNINKENSANGHYTEASSTKGSFANLNNASKMNGTENSSSTMQQLTKQQSLENKTSGMSSEILPPPVPSVPVVDFQNQRHEHVADSEQSKHERFCPKQINLSYTDQLKSLLEAHQSFNQQKTQISNNNDCEETGLLNCSQLNNKPWTSPISISTSNINNMNTVQFSPNNPNSNIMNANKKSKIPLSETVNRQMTMLSSSPSSSSSLSPISQQLFLSSPNLSDSNSVDPLCKQQHRPEPPKQLELETGFPFTSNAISTQMISPTAKTEIKIDINGFNKLNQQQPQQQTLQQMQHNDPEGVYDLPTPPMEIFNTAPDYDSTVTSISSLPSPTQSSSTSLPTVQSQIIVQLADNRNSKQPAQPVQQQQQSTPIQSIQQVQQVPAPPVAPKPVFKRLNSFANNNFLNETDSAINNTQNFTKNNEIQSNKENSNNNNAKERRSFGMTSNNHFRGSSLSRTSSLMQQQQQQQQNSDASNELAAILARQKKKIEAQTGDTDASSFATHQPRSSQIGCKNNKLPSPNIAAKPPPPPRTDRSHSFTRKMSNEY